MIVRGCDIMEIYSPTRVGRICAEYGLVPGPALDLRTGFDLSTSADRARALALYREKDPELVTLSPPCTEFSRLQALNRYLHGQKYAEAHDKLKGVAVKHVELCIKIATMLIRKGRWFIFEHPANAKSWSLAEVQKLGREEGVSVYHANQCMYGLKTWGKGGLKRWRPRSQPSS